MRWRLILALALGFSSLGLCFTAPAFRSALVQFLMCLVAVDLLMLCMALMQDDGWQMLERKQPAARANAPNPQRHQFPPDNCMDVDDGYVCKEKKGHAGQHVGASDTTVHCWHIAEQETVDISLGGI